MLFLLPNADRITQLQYLNHLRDSERQATSQQITQNHQMYQNAINRLCDNRREIEAFINKQSRQRMAEINKMIASLTANADLETNIKLNAEHPDGARADYLTVKMSKQAMFELSSPCTLETQYSSSIDHDHTSNIPVFRLQNNNMTGESRKRKLEESNCVDFRVAGHHQATPSKKKRKRSNPAALKSDVDSVNESDEALSEMEYDDCSSDSDFELDLDTVCNDDGSDTGDAPSNDSNVAEIPSLENISDGDEHPSKLTVSIECEDCGEKFTKYNKFKQHMLKKHGVDRPFACSWCDHRCKQRGNLKTHITSQHPEQLATFLQTNPFNKYDKSDKKESSSRFRSKKKTVRSLKDETPTTNAVAKDTTRKIHKPPYYCKICDRHFKNGQALGGHNSIVHSAKRSGSASESSVNLDQL